MIGIALKPIGSLPKAIQKKVAERVGLLTAGDGRSSSASLRTAALDRGIQKSLRDFCRTQRVDSGHPGPRPLGALRASKFAPAP
jgi:hypothetical protein